MTLKMQLREIHMHANYQVSITIGSKDMVNVKVGDLIYMYIFDI